MSRRRRKMLMVGEKPIEEGFILLEGTTDKIELEGLDGFILLEEPSHNIQLEGSADIILLEDGIGTILQEF